MRHTRSAALLASKASKIIIMYDAALVLARVAVSSFIFPCGYSSFCMIFISAYRNKCTNSKKSCRRPNVSHDGVTALSEPTPLLHTRLCRVKAAYLLGQGLHHTSKLVFRERLFVLFACPHASVSMPVIPKPQIPCITRPLKPPKSPKCDRRPWYKSCPNPATHRPPSTPHSHRH